MMHVVYTLVILFVLFNLGARGRKSSCADTKHDLVKIAKDKSNVVDLSHVFDAKSIYWPDNPFGFEFIDRLATNDTDPDVYYATNSYRAPEHIGTHIDAPIHFALGAADVSKVCLLNLMGRGLLVNMENNGERMDAAAFVTVSDLENFETTQDVKIEANDIVFLNTGFGRSYGNRLKYLGTNLTGDAAMSEFKFPGLHPDAATWLAERQIAAVGIDTASIDQSKSTTFKSHRVLAQNNIPNFENVANLHKLIDNPTNFYVIALPVKIVGGTGTSVRIIAISQKFNTDDSCSLHHEV